MTTKKETPKNTLAEQITDFDRENWIETDSDRVYYHSGSDKFGRGEVELATWVADHIPRYDVVITMGPYRMDYDIGYFIYNDEGVIQLDCYSAGFTVYGDDVGYRKEHPAKEWAESTIHDIAQGVDYSQWEDKPNTEESDNE